jgi:hypothetical protein
MRRVGKNMENLVVLGGEAEDGMGRDEAGNGCNAFNLLAISLLDYFTSHASQ